MTTFRAVLAGHVIAQSDATILLEGNRYFPLAAVDPTALKRSRMKSLCYWKGIASYYTLTAGGITARHAAWTYRHPSPLARRIKDHVAFWPGDVVVEEIGHRVVPNASQDPRSDIPTR